MAQKEANTERTGDAPFAMLAPTAFALEDFANTQTELLDKLLETNRQWFDRMQLEANVASELGSKLTASRSIPDAMTAWQEWATRRFEMMAEDRKHLLTDCQIFTETGARLLSKGWLQNGSGKSA